MLSLLVSISQSCQWSWRLLKISSHTRKSVSVKAPWTTEGFREEWIFVQCQLRHWLKWCRISKSSARLCNRNCKGVLKYISLLTSHPYQGWIENVKDFWIVREVWISELSIFPSFWMEGDENGLYCPRRLCWYLWSIMVSVVRAAGPSHVDDCILCCCWRPCQCLWLPLKAKWMPMVCATTGGHVEVCSGMLKAMLVSVFLLWAGISWISVVHVTTEEHEDDHSLCCLLKPLPQW